MNAPFEPQRFINPLTTRPGINEALIFAAEHGVSDIKLQPGQRPIAEVGGVQYPLTAGALTAAHMKIIADELYGNNAASGMILSGTPVNGAYDIIHGNSRLRFRYNATGCYAPGEQSIWIAIRAIPSIPPSVEDLGVEKAIIDRVRPEKGIILVAGVTGSGKSTLQAAMLRKIAETPGKTRSETIITIEAPIEFVYDGVKKDSTIIVQQELGRDIKHGQVSGEFVGSLWGGAISNAMRQKPTIINPSELRDQDAYRAAITAAATGHLCYSSVHTESVSSTIFRIVNEFPPQEQQGVGIGLLANLQTVICQHLIPKKGGGRVAVREYLHFTSEDKRNLMRAEPPQWMPMLRDIMDRVPPDLGRKGITHVREHFQNGLIDEVEMARWEVEAEIGGLG